jgi:DNA replication licensing factor MCM6
VTLAPTPASDGNFDAPNEELVYIEQIHTMREYQLTTLYVDYGHLLSKDDVLADAIQKQYYRFLPYLRRALYNLVAEYEPTYLKVNPTAAATDSSNLQTREFSVAFYHLPLVSGIRDLRTDKIGTLMSISGTVTRTSEVRPELLFGSFICDVCGGLVNEVEQQFKYTEVSTVFFTACRQPDQLSSRAFAQTLRAVIVQHGNYRSIAQGSQTGRRLEFKRTHQRFPRALCLGPWMSFSVGS